MVVAVLEFRLGESRPGRGRVECGAVMGDDEAWNIPLWYPDCKPRDCPGTSLPFLTMSRTTSSCRRSYAQSIVRYGLSHSPITPNVLNSPVWIAMPFSASRRAARRISCGVRDDAGLLRVASAFSSRGSPCVSKPGV